MAFKAPASPQSAREERFGHQEIQTTGQSGSRAKLSAGGKGSQTPSQQQQEEKAKIIIFYAFSLGIYGVQFWGFSVLHCHGVFPSGVPAAAAAAKASAAAGVGSSKQQPAPAAKASAAAGVGSSRPQPAPAASSRQEKT